MEEKKTICLLFILNTRSVHDKTTRGERSRRPEIGDDRYADLLCFLSISSVRYRFNYTVRASAV